MESAHLAEPDLEHILQLARRLRAYWQPQHTLDKELQAFEMMAHPLYGAKAEGAPGSGKRLSSGIWTQLVRRDAAIISFAPYIRFNPPDPDDAEARAHSSLLESWVNAGLARSGVGAALQERLARSLIGYGRAWTKTLWLPQVWATPDIEEAVAKLERAGSDEERAAARRELQARQRDRWPITVRYVDPIGTYSYFDAAVWLPEVIEIRQMTPEAAAHAYGRDAVRDAGTSSGGHVEVIEYSNHEWQATVIPAGRGGRLVNVWRHRLGRSPYVLAETNMAITSVEGIRWLPPLFHAKELIEAFDEVLTDWRTNTHDNALGHIQQFFDPDYLSEDDKEAGRPRAVEMKPGGTSAWLKGEDAKLAPVPTLTPEHSAFRQMLYSLIQANAIQPVLEGETNARDSYTLLAGAHQLAERKFGPAMDALLAAAEDRAKTLLRCVVAIGADPAGVPGKIFVFDRYRGKGAVGIGASDVVGWEEAIQARGQPALPMDRNREVAIASGLKGLGVAETVILEELGYEDPEGLRRRSQKEMLEAQVFQNVILPYAIQRAQQKLQEATPAETAQAQQLAGEASPGIAQAVSQILGQAGGQEPGLAQALSNVRRAGVPYAPREELSGLGSQGGPPA